MTKKAIAVCYLDDKKDDITTEELYRGMPIEG